MFAITDCVDLYTYIYGIMVSISRNNFCRWGIGGFCIGGNFVVGYFLKNSTFQFDTTSLQYLFTIPLCEEDFLCKIIMAAKPINSYSRSN